MKKLVLYLLFFSVFFVLSSYCHVEEDSGLELDENYLDIVERIMREDNVSDEAVVEDDGDEKVERQPDKPLGEEQKKEIFMEILALEEKLEQEAKQKFPDSMLEQLKYVGTKVSELDERIMKKYNISREELIDIKIEGVGL